MAAIGVALNPAAAFAVGLPIAYAFKRQWLRVCVSTAAADMASDPLPASFEPGRYGGRIYKLESGRRRLVPRAVSLTVEIASSGGAKKTRSWQ